MAEIVFSFLVLIFSVVLHEVSHALVAEALGDPTARAAGRITLNPLKHLDPFGSVMLPIFSYLATLGQGPVFGYARPVPVNPLLFKDRRWGTLKVSLAGPLSNFLLATVFALLIRFLPWPEKTLSLLALISFYNFVLAFFNLLPLPPLDGFHIFSSLAGERFPRLKIFFLQYSFLFLFLILFWGLNFVGSLAYFFLKFFSNFGG